MTTLQTDIIELYNQLVAFSDSTVQTNFPTPIEVTYDDKGRYLVFSQRGKTVFTNIPRYYSLGFEDLVGKGKSYLLPQDYDFLMSSFQEVITGGELLNSRTCLSPENYGFDIWAIDQKDLDTGLTIIGKFRFISGTSWLFKWRTKRKYGI